MLKLLCLHFAIATNAQGLENEPGTPLPAMRVKAYFFRHPDDSFSTPPNFVVFGMVPLLLSFALLLTERANRFN